MRSDAGDLQRAWRWYGARGRGARYAVATAVIAVSAGVIASGLALPLLFLAAVVLAARKRSGGVHARREALAARHGYVPLTDLATSSPEAEIEAGPTARDAALDRRRALAAEYGHVPVSEPVTAEGMQFQPEAETRVGRLGLLTALRSSPPSVAPQPRTEASADTVVTARAPPSPPDRPGARRNSPAPGAAPIVEGPRRRWGRRSGSGSIVD